MKKSTFIIFVGYIWIKTLYGLTFHPYKSTHEMTRHRVLLPVVFSPIYGLVVLFITGRIGTFLFETQGFLREIMAIILSSALISILMWQLFLLYLLFTFIITSKKKYNH